MTATQNGAPTMHAPQAVDVIPRDLPGDVHATLVTVADATGIESGVQLTAPDEPLDAPTLRQLSRALWDAAAALENLTGG